MNRIGNLNIFRSLVFAVILLSPNAFAQAEVWFVPPAYAGGGSQCLIPGVFGSDPDQVAILAQKANNAVTTNQCWMACRNPYTHLGVTVNGDSAVAKLVSNCTGMQYQYAITKISNPKQPVCDATDTVANPCNVASGAKVQQATDFLDPVGDLSLSRTYNSASAELFPSQFGRKWQSNFDRRAFGTLLPINASDVRAMTIFFWRPEGRGLPFHFDAATQQWKGDPDISEHAEELVTPQGVHQGWVLESVDQVRREVYDALGKLIRVEDARGAYLWLTYDTGGVLSRVVDLSGRALNFSSGGGNITGVTLPDGSTIGFVYNAGILNKVVYPDSTPATQADNPRVEYVYEQAGQPQLLTGIIDENGTRSSSWDYDAEQRVTLSVHGGSASLVDRVTIAYNANGSALVTQPLGQQATLNFSEVQGVRHLSSVSGSCPSCNGAQFSQITFDSNGYRDGAVDSVGNLVDFDFDTRGRLVKQVDAANASNGATRTKQTDWHPTLPVPVERRIYNAANALVAKTAWTYNARGQALTATQTDPATTASRTTTNTYCEQPNADVGTCPRVGLLLSIDGPRTDIADTTTYTYYPGDDPTCATAPTTCPHRKGDLWKVTNALGHVTETLAYDGASRPLSIKDATGIVTELTYHPRGWLTSRTVKGATQADDRSMLIDYWPTGLVKRVTQADGSYTAYIYDAAHRLTDVTDSAGNTLHYMLDNAGNRMGEDTLDPNGTLTRALSRVYNQLGQLQSQADAYGHATGYAYDANGNSTSITDALGRGTISAYDPLNRLVATLQDAGGIAAQTQFAYDAQDNLTRVTDPKGLHTDYSYNGLGDLTGLSSPDTGVMAYTYDSAGNRTGQTDARAKTQAYTYDALNRLTKITGPTRTYTYDNNNTSVCPSAERFGKGRLTGFTDQSGSTKYCYNRFGDLTRKVQTTNGVAFTTRYGYDAAGRLTTQTYPDGAVLDAVRDGEGRVTELGVTPTGGVRQVVLTGARYAPFGPSTGWTYGNGRTLARSLNANYQPQAIEDAATGGLSLGYGFDAAGNLTVLADAPQTATLAQYGYDGLNRLTQVMDGPTGTPIETYAYDATGNRTALTNAGATTAYTYAPDSHRLDSVGNVARLYDPAGNTTKIGGNARQFVYDNSGRMTQVKSGSVVTRQYQYNAKGEQVRAYLDTDSAYFAYDEAGRLLGEYDDGGSPKQQFLWFGDLPVGVLQGSGSSQQMHYIEPDHLGAPRAIIDGSRNVAIWEWKLTGEAFGATPPNQDPDQDGTVFILDLRFPGQRYDNATGLNYNYFRDYDPTTGRYVQSDPIGLEGGATTYSYVNDSPLMKVDELGLLEHFVFYLNDKNMSTLSCECGKSYNAFSGTGDARNDPGESQNVDNGPIPPGRYYIVKRPSGGRLGFVDTWKGKDDWFALYADDGSPNDYTATGIQLRGQFRLHPGTISKGCVTLPSKTDFDELKKRLINTKKEYIPGTKTIYYGTIVVK